MATLGPVPTKDIAKATGFFSLSALRLLDGSVNLQAALLSFGDTFWITARLFLVSVPLVLLLEKPPKGTKVSAGH